MKMRVTEGVTGWALRRAARKLEGGRLLYMSDDGELVDLGSYTRDELAVIAYAHRMAYRLTHERSERTALATAREAALRLAREVSKLQGSKLDLR